MFIRGFGGVISENTHLKIQEFPVNRGLYLYTVRVAYYEPAYYEHLFIMDQAEGPNRYILMHLY